MPKFWEISPNWREGYQVAHEFRTDIIESRSRREQRNALRAEPRKSISFKATCTRDRYGLLQRSIAAGAKQGESWYIPEITEGTPIDAIAAAGQATISPASLPFWMTAGQPVVVMLGSKHELGVINQILAGDLVLQSNLLSTWPIGAKVAPARTAYLEEEISGENPTNNTIELTVNFVVEVGLDPVEPVPVATVTFNGREVFSKKPNWKEPLQETFRSGRESINYGQGRMAHFLPARFPTTVRKAAFLGRNKTEIDAIRYFFLRMRGQQGEFYMPSGTQDIIPNASLVSGQSTLVVAGTAFADAYDADSVHRAICVYLTNGTVLYRLVSAIAAVATNSQITLSTSWASTIPLTDIVMVSWMPAWRLSSDTVVFEWLTDAVAQVALSMQTVEDLPGG